MKKFLVVDDLTECYPAAGTGLLLATLASARKESLLVCTARDYREAEAHFDDDFDGVLTDCFFPYQTGSDNRELAEQAIGLLAPLQFVEQRNIDALRAAVRETAQKQPLGILVAEHFHTRGTPVVITTSTSHSSALGEPISEYSLERNIGYWEACPGMEKIDTDFWSQAYFHCLFNPSA
ncbi:MAG: hypothetical protein OXR66_01725 [Candidatus Woesearchaeota archaeon]|nr:hypothetical protein [Candidatus Woesearchaeota archaeon]